jgi:hypothetical protein
MDLAKIAGIVIIVGSVLFMFAATPGPNIYALSDPKEQLAVIAQHRTNWIVSNAGFGLGALATAVGFGLLSLRLRGGQAGWLNAVAAGAMLVGAFFWAFLVARRAIRPDEYFPYSAASLWPGWIYYGLTVLALAAYGFVFFEAGYAAWVGYVTLGFAGLLTVAAIAAGNALPPQILYLPALVIGIVMLVAR